MDVYTHTALALIAMYSCFLWGKYLTHLDIVDDVISKTLVKLEDEGFIKTEIDEDGDKTLIKIEE